MRVAGRSAGTVDPVVCVWGFVCYDSEVTYPGNNVPFYRASVRRVNFRLALAPWVGQFSAIKGDRFSIACFDSSLVQDTTFFY